MKTRLPLMDAYNVAVRYLCEKYKKTYIGYHFVEDNNIKKFSDDHSMVLLVEAFYLGQSVKRDLESLLTRMDLPFEKRYN